ncbi:RNA helicase [Parasedimentitalea marina]|uniref:RNA helicase n=1 Tax=Parasedimentitalea marina TaxID=2483033 RepID=A0A3T0N620_9RHOB|nr:RNA helicase [Parasedimentitalea marina]AZV79493.1 RNA helicase [Parasedimentitalea marina]
MSAKNKSANGKSSTPDVEPERPMCGIVMPISEIDGCSASHWKEVLGIVAEATENAGYKAKIVSESDDVGVIQTRIVQNLYDSEIVVCDVSAKNANVMFELGLRLAFDKPAIVIKDDQTSYSFDTSPIEHLEYPRDLRYSSIQKFKTDLAKKIKATVEASKKSDYTTFLKHFGKFEVKGLDTKEVSKQEFLASELSSLRNQMSRIERSMDSGERPSRSRHTARRPPTSFTAKKIAHAIDKGELHKADLIEDPKKVCAYLFGEDDSLFDAFDSVGEYEEHVLQAVDRLIN